MQVVENEGSEHSSSIRCSEQRRAPSRRADRRAMCAADRVPHRTRNRCQTIAPRPPCPRYAHMHTLVSLCVTVFVVCRLLLLLFVVTVTVVRFVTASSTRQKTTQQRQLAFNNCTSSILETLKPTPPGGGGGGCARYVKS
jgi:hypothetical protein